MVAMSASIFIDGEAGTMGLGGHNPVLLPMGEGGAQRRMRVGCGSAAADAKGYGRPSPFRARAIASLSRAQALSQWERETELK